MMIADTSVDGQKRGVVHGIEIGIVTVIGIEIEAVVTEIDVAKTVLQERQKKTDLMMM